MKPRISQGLILATTAICLLLALAGCSTPAATVAPPPHRSVTPVPTATPSPLASPTSTDNLTPTPSATLTITPSPTATQAATHTPTATTLPGCEVLFKSLSGYFGNPNLAILVPWDAAQFAAGTYSLAGIAEDSVTCETKGSYLQCIVESTVLFAPYAVTFWDGPVALCQASLQFAYLPTSTPEPTDVPPTSEPEPTDISLPPSQTPIPTQPPFVTPTAEG